MNERIVTESWADKRYENDLTRRFFEVLEKLERAERYPAYEYIKDAFASLKSFADAMVYSDTHIKRYKETIRPLFDDITKILYGDPNSREIAEAMIKYNVKVTSGINGTELKNGILIIRLISDTMFLLKQWLYEEGLFLPKPIDRKHGTEAIEETLEM